MAVDLLARAAALAPGDADICGGLAFARAQLAEQAAKPKVEEEAAEASKLEADEAAAKKAAAAAAKKEAAAAKKQAKATEIQINF